MFKKIEKNMGDKMLENITIQLEFEENDILELKLRTL